jgi:hypothetical protein
MINFFRRLFNIQKVQDLEFRLENLKKEMERKLAKAEAEKNDIGYFLANRYYLSSVGPEHLDNVFNSMTERAKKDYVARASEIWANPIFREEIKRMEGSQSLFVSSECQNWEQSLVGRGTINGVGLVEDRFRRLHGMHLDNITQGKKVDEGGEGNGIPAV